MTGGLGGMGSGVGGMSGDAGTDAGQGGNAGVHSGGAGGMETGGNGGGAGSGGAAGFGGSGGPAGGTGGADAGADTCTDSDALSADLSFDPYALEAAQLLEKGTTIGANGRFEDSCTESGDVLEHVCETQLTCNKGGEPFDGACAPMPQLTGQVIEVSTYCFGLCVDGVCNVPCPQAGDELTVAYTDATNVHFESSAGLRYECARDACLALPPAVGDTLTVDASPVPNETQLDCRLAFANAGVPLTLSDGCTYSACSVQDPAAP